MKFIICALIVKALSLVGRILGKGTDKPGKIVLKLYPHIMKKLKFTGKVLAITGSNGKTTTANVVAHVLKESGCKVVNNELGSNMTSGVATTLLEACTLTGKVKADFVVLEVDEAYSRFIFEDLPIDYYLVLNLLRDQVVRNGHPDLVYAKIAEAIGKQPNMTLILNAQEPISQNLATAANPAVYFSMDRTERSTDRCVSGTHDAKICPKCFHPMEYDFFHYNHLGTFHCTHCGYGSHAPDFVGAHVDFANQRLTINGTVVEVPYNTTFNMFNTVAAAALCVSAGLTLDQFAAHVKTFKGAKGRLDSFDFEGRKTTLMMTKQNAASLDQSISFVLEQPGEKSVVLFINNVLYLDYKDISWLYDVAFDRLQSQVRNILCTGNRALDAAICVKAAGFDEGVLLYENDLSKVKEAFRKTSGDIYILAASAFGHEGKIIEELKK